MATGIAKCMNCAFSAIEARAFTGTHLLFCAAFKGAALPPLRCFRAWSWGTELVLLGVDGHADVLAFLCRRMVPLRRVYAQPELAEEGDRDVLQLHGRREGSGEEGEVVDDYEQAPVSRRRLRTDFFFALLDFPVGVVDSGSRSLLTKTSVSFWNTYVLSDHPIGSAYSCPIYIYRKRLSVLGVDRQRVEAVLQVEGYPVVSRLRDES